MSNVAQSMWKYVPSDQRVQLRRLAHKVKRRMSPPEVNPLEEYFWANDDRLIHKWSQYFDIYHRHFAPYRGKKINVLEFGVSHGGSLQMWKHYFGKHAQITGVDIKPRCAKLAEDRIDVVIGDQGDREFLRKLGRQLGKIDVLIDDGGHTMEQQIATFEELWPRIRNGGVLAMEDLHTSYHAKYGGGLNKPGTYIEYAKDLIDKLHAWHIPGVEADDYTRSIAGMHVYNSIIVFDKAVVTRPTHPKTGHPSF
ncbi:MAG TPA: class I SAM-dependent methyltransferase [Microlunatus sp.]